MEPRLGRFLGAGLLAFEAIAGNAACVDQVKQPPIATSRAVTGPVAGPQLPERPALVVTSLQEWQGVPSLTRIQELELKRYPSFAEFDGTKELAMATAQFYCEQTTCKTSAKEMGGNIFFVSPERFIEEAQKDVGRTLSQAEINDQLDNRLEMVSNKTKQSFINSDLLKQVMERTKQESPDVVASLQKKGIDFETVYKKSLFFHIYAHKAQQENTYTFAPFSMQIPTKTEGTIKVPRIGTLEGFTFVGERENGKPIYINGAKEAVAERDAQIVGSRSGPYLTLAYKDSAGLVAQLNRLSGVSDNEFLAVAHGQKDVAEMFKKWATLNKTKPDERTGVLALAAVGLQIDFAGSRAETLKNLAGLAGISLQ